MKFNKTDWIIIVLLGMISFCIYADSLHGDFLIDDQATIVRDERLHDLGTFFSKYFRLAPGEFPPLITALLWHISPNNPFYFHLFYVLAHVFCVALFYILCNALFNNRNLSFFSSLIFAVHPIHTEAVCWISGGHYVFSSLFFFLSLIF